MRAVCICNPAAALGRGAARIRALQPTLASWPSPPEMLWTRAAGEAEALARRVRAEGAGLIVAVGGDGTAHEVLNGMLQEGIEGAPVFAHLAVGTGCDLARGLALPAAGAFAGLLPDAPVARVDLGCARFGARRRYFFNAANLGLGAAVARRVASSRALRRLGGAAYAVGAALALRRPPRIRVEYRSDDGEPWRGELLHLAVCNGPSFGGGLRPSPQAGFTSGRLHVVRVRPLSRLPAFAQLARLRLGLPLRHPAVALWECRRLQVRAEGEIEIDGEIAASAPDDFQVLPAALGLKVPRRPRAAGGGGAD